MFVKTWYLATLLASVTLALSANIPRQSGNTVKYNANYDNLPSNPSKDIGTYKALTYGGFAAYKPVKGSLIPQSRPNAALAAPAANLSPNIHTAENVSTVALKSFCDSKNKMPLKTPVACSLQLTGTAALDGLVIGQSFSFKPEGTSGVHMVKAVMQDVWSHANIDNIVFRFGNEGQTDTAGMIDNPLYEAEFK